jgi:hypothetical protein
VHALVTGERQINRTTPPHSVILPNYSAKRKLW